MRITWYVILALVTIATGCTAGGGFSTGYSVAQQGHPQQAQLAARQQETSQQPSFTQRVTDSIASVVPGMGKQDPPAPQAASPQLDPISLGFKSGPMTADLYLSMAQLSDRGGNLDHARSMYEKALAIDPKHRDSLLGLARLEDREGRMQQALQVYQQAATAHPRDAKVLNDLALCYARTGQMTASADLLNQATILDPGKGLYRNNFAKVLIELNEIDAAISQLSVVHPPAVVQYNMGVLLNERERKDEALHFLTAATHIDPQLQQASALLAELQGGAETQVASGSNDGILPTPMISQSVGMPYPSTNAPSQPAYQTLPSETAKAPVGAVPTSLPAVR